MASQLKVAPGTVVDSFLHESYTDENGNKTLHYYREKFWQWSTNRYIKKTNATIWKEFSRWLELNMKIPARSDWATLREIMEYRLLLPEEQALPAWIGMTKPDTQTISFKNGLLDLSTNRLEAHSPQWFSPICLPYDYEPGALCPRWLEKLDEILEGDPQRIALLQEWFGYCLTPDTSFQKCMLFYGVPRAGKGVIADILKRVLGPDNVSGVRLELFGERFQLGPTVGKLLNIADEVDRRTKFHEGIFKSFVAAEDVPAEIKGKDPVSVAPTARLLMLANEQLPFKDVSGATATRLLILSFDKSFAGKEKLDLKEYLSTELPGIFNWALEGRRSLYAKGIFTAPDAGEKDKEEMVISNNHILTWVQDNLEEDKDAMTHTKTIYENYRTWCKEHGVDHPIMEGQLIRTVRSALKLPRTWETKVVKEFGRPVRCWPGFKLQED